MRKFVFIVLISSIINTGYSKTPFFNHLSTEDGLGSNFVSNIFMDNYGYTWFGHVDGINRFDGQEVKNYNHYFPDKPSAVFSIAEDENNHLWIGTETSLFYWDRVSSTFTKIPLLNNQQVYVTKIIPNQNQTIYIGTNLGFFSYDLKTGFIYRIPFHENPNHSLNQISDFLIEDNHIYISTMGGFVQYDLSNNTHSAHVENISLNHQPEKFFAISKYKDDIYLAAETKGLWCFSLKNKLFTKPKAFENDIIQCVKRYEQYMFFGLGTQGIKVLDLSNNESEYILPSKSDPNSISPNVVKCLLKDQNEILWVGTFGGGLDYGLYSKKTFLNYKTRSNSFINQSIRSICFDKNGAKILGTRNGLYVIDKHDSTKYYAKDNVTLRGQTIFSIFKYQNKFLIGTKSGGVSSYSTQTGTLELWNDQLLHDRTISDFDQDSQENLWIGAMGDLFLFSKKGDVKNFNTSNSVLVDQVIFSVKVDTLNRIWVACKSGVFIYKFEHEELKLVDELDLGYKGRAIHLFLDSSNRIWIGTDSHGVYLFDMDLNLKENFTKKQGLCNNSITSIIEVKPSEFWISTVSGLTYYNYKKKTYRNFLSSPEWPGPIFSRGASLTDEQGIVWMGNEKGLVYFDHEETLNKQTTNKLVISDIYLGGKSLMQEIPNSLNQPIEELKSFELPGANNSIGFRFVDLNIMAANQYNMSVKLLGKDTAWLQADNNEIFYSSLEPGKYKFSVGLCNAQGIIDESHIRSLDIIILPQWYQRTSLIIIIISVLLILGTGLTYLVYKDRFAQEVKSTLITTEKYELSTLDCESSKASLEKIQDYLEQSQAYLQTDLKITDISEAINIPGRYISQSINENLNQGFTYFINTYRIKEVKKRMNSPKYKKYTLAAIAETCGFNSKSSFNRIFKKTTGQTPTEYLSQSNNQ